MELKINNATQLVMAAAVCLNLLFLSAVASPIPLGRRSTENELATHMESTEVEEQVPQLLLDIYKCWNNGNKNCLPYTDPEVNLVTTLLGKFEENSPQAVQSVDHDRELTDSVAITFNSSIFPHEVLHMAELRVYKNALSEKDVDSLRQQCNGDLSNLKILLYSTQQEDKDKDIVILESSLPLSVDSLNKAEWLSFSNVTRMVRPGDSFLRLRLAMGDSCPNVSPSVFGLSFGQSGYQPELITFAKSEAQDNLPAKFLEEFRRKKRQTAISQPPADNSTETQSQKPSTIAEYKAAKCQLHDFNVSFAEIDWDRHVIEPASYNARLCAGRCDWPLDKVHNYTKHAYIQSILNLKNPGVVPAPCCAPTDLLSMPVVVRRSDNQFETRWWDNMIANSCGCL